MKECETVKWKAKCRVHSHQEVEGGEDEKDEENGICCEINEQYDQKKGNKTEEWKKDK